MNRLDLIFPDAIVKVYGAGNREDALAWLNGEDMDVDVPSPKGQEQ